MGQAGLFVKKKLHFEHYVVLSSLQGSAVLAIEGTQLDTPWADNDGVIGKLFVPEIKSYSVDDLIVLPIFNINDWECIPVRWRSPLSLHAQTGDQEFSGRICAEQIGPAEDILVVSARHAFWNITKPILFQLQTHRGLGMRSSSLLIMIVEALVRDILKLDNDEDSNEIVLEILALRLNKHEPVKEAFKDEKALQLLHKREQDAMSKQVTKVEQAELDESEYFEGLENV
jgi:hypothetical protein